MLKERKKADTKLKPKKMYTIGVKRDAVIKLKSFALAHGFTQGSIIETALDEFIDNYGKEK